MLSVWNFESKTFCRNFSVENFPLDIFWQCLLQSHDLNHGKPRLLCVLDLICKVSKCSSFSYLITSCWYFFMFWNCHLNFPATVFPLVFAFWKEIIATKDGHGLIGVLELSHLTKDFMFPWVIFPIFTKFMQTFWVIFQKGLELFSKAWVIFPQKSLSYFWNVEKISLP